VSLWVLVRLLTTCLKRHEICDKNYKSVRMSYSHINKLPPTSVSEVQSLSSVSPTTEKLSQLAKQVPKVEEEASPQQRQAFAKLRLLQIMRDTEAEMSTLLCMYCFHVLVLNVEGNRRDEKCNVRVVETR
jgi:hypothetical protein